MRACCLWRRHALIVFLGGWSEAEVVDLGTHLVGVIGLELNDALGVDQDQGRDRLDAVGIGEGSRGVKDRGPGITSNPVTPLGCRTIKLAPGIRCPEGGAGKGDFCSATSKGSRGLRRVSAHRSPLRG